MAAKDIESAFNTVDMDKSGEISKRVSSHFSYVFMFSQMILMLKQTASSAFKKGMVVKTQIDISIYWVSLHSFSQYYF